MMPIVFVHGVAVRDQSSLPGIETFLTQYVAPAMVTSAADAAKVKIFSAFWGRDAAHFAWDGASLPSPIQAQALGGAGLDVAQVLANDRALSESASATPRAQSLGTGAPVMVSANDVSNLMTSVMLRDFVPAYDGVANVAVSADTSRSIIAFHEAALQVVPSGTRAALTPDLLQSVGARAEDIYKTLTPPDVYVPQSVLGDIISAVTQKAKDVVGNIEDAGAVALTNILKNYRQPLNSGITTFFGDVFTYLSTRGTAETPGLIVGDVLAAVAAAHDAPRTSPTEPLVILSHSMGGQIIYDLVTFFLPRIRQYQDIRVDFWVAAASQVGLFEEMKLFKVSSPAYSAAKQNKVPFPSRDYLGYWLNVWDPDDFLSYTAAPIFEGVDDESFDSGLSVLKAHGGYLVSPAFYGRVGAKVREMAAVRNTP
jgi:hypothetical protein